MEWTREPPTPKPDRKCSIHCGGVMLSVSESAEDEGKIWQYLAYSNGAFSGLTFEQCLETWPRLAIQLAREALNELELKLSQGEKADDEIVASVD